MPLKEGSRSARSNCESRKSDDVVCFQLRLLSPACATISVCRSICRPICRSIYLGTIGFCLWYSVRLGLCRSILVFNQVRAIILALHLPDSNFHFFHLPFP